MTLKEAAQLALDVQNACNLSGVVRSFAQVTEVLWEEARKQGAGTAWVNHHSISILFASKIYDLTGGDEYPRLGAALDECKRLASE